MNRRQLIFIGGVIGLFVLLGGIFWLYQRSLFRVISAEPKGESSSIAPVVFTFDRPLSDSTAQEFVITPYAAGRTYIEGNTLRFEPTQSYFLDTEYTASLTTAHATDGSEKKNVKVTFTPTLKNVAKLTESERAAEESKTDSLEGDSPFLARLPQETIDYKIDYEVLPAINPEDKDHLLLKVDLYGIFNRPDQRDSYVAELKSHRQAALDWIRSQGVDPEKYVIRFVPNPDDPFAQVDSEQ